MSNYESGLSRNRIDSLPVKRDKDGKAIIVKSRPQENPSCVNAYGGFARERGGRKVKLPLHKTEVYVDVAEDGKGVKKLVKVSEYLREYDNPDKPDVCLDANGKLQWTDSGFSNLTLALDYVSVLNNPENRRKAYKVYIANDYAMSLRRANLCHSCKRPLKTANAEVAYKENLEVVRNTVYADIKSHYEVAKNVSGKHFFHYVDGTGRVILSRKTKFGSEFYLRDSGEVVYPASEYRVERSKCGCGLK